MDNCKAREIVEVVEKYENGEVDRLKILSQLCEVAGVDSEIYAAIQFIFKDCSKVKRSVGQPRKVEAREIILRKISGDTYRKIADDMHIGVSTVYRALKNNKDLEKQLRNEIFNNEK